MPTIYFNDKLKRNLNQALFTRNYFGVAPGGESGQYGLVNYFLYSSSTQYSRPGTIKLMKGVVPTDFSELISIDSKSTDLLCTWTTNSGTWTYSDPVNNLDGIAKIDTPYSTASASGIASWFWWYVYDTTNTIKLQLVGTVGTSGTDLVIADTTIIAGANYRFVNLKFDIPTEYTY